MFLLILEIVHITSSTQRIIYLKELRDRWPDTPTWPFLDMKMVKPSKRRSKSKNFENTIKHLKKLGGQWFSMVILCHKVYVGFQRSQTKIMSKFSRAVDVRGQWTWGQWMWESNISVYKLCKVKIESLSVPSNLAIDRVASGTVKHWLYWKKIKMPFFSSVLGTVLGFFWFIKVFLDFPEMQNLKLSPTIVETCPDPIWYYVLGYTGIWQYLIVRLWRIDYLWYGHCTRYTWSARYYSSLKKLFHVFSLSR